jgi:hypothetical protein
MFASYYYPPQSPLLATIFIGVHPWFIHLSWVAATLLQALRVLVCLSQGRIREEKSVVVVAFLFASFSFVEGCGYVDNFLLLALVFGFPSLGTPWEGEAGGGVPFVPWARMQPATEIVPAPG